MFTTITVSLGVAGLELAGRVGIVPLPRRGRDSYNYSLPIGMRFGGHVRLRRGVAGARPVHSDGLIRRLSAPRLVGEVVTHHSIAPK